MPLLPSLGCSKSNVFSLAQKMKTYGLFAFSVSINPQEEKAPSTAPFYTLQKRNKFFLPFSFSLKVSALS